MNLTERIDRPILVSVGWTFVLFNMIYADIIGMLRPGYLDLLDDMSRQLGPGSILTFSILMEVPIGMVVLGRVLSRRANRLVHLVAIPLTIVYVIFGGLDAPPVSYLFFGGVEIAAMLAIGALVWSWPKRTDEATRAGLLT